MTGPRPIADRVYRTAVAIGTLLTIFGTPACRPTPDPHASVLTADPNPVGPGRLGTGTTTLRWRTAERGDTDVYVSVDGNPEVLFAAGGEGHQTAPWISTGSSYEFRLYREEPPRTLLAAVVVHRRDDAFSALELSLVGLIACLLILAIGLVQPRRAWLLEIGPLAVMLGTTWTKLLAMTVALRPTWGFVPDERRALSGTLAILLLLWAPLVWLDRRWRIVGLCGLCLLLTTIGVADLVHARFYDDVMTINEITMAPQLRLETAAFGAIVRPADAVPYADCLLLIAFMPIYRRACGQIAAIGRPVRRRLAVTLAAAAIVLAVPGWRLIGHAQPANIFSRRGAVAEMGLLPFQVYDAARAFAAPFRRRWSVSAADTEEARRVVAGIRAEAAAPSPLFGIAKGRNLILISAESLNAFPIDAVIDGTPVMPYLHALVRESLWFTNFYDEAYLGTTSDAELLALESLYPLADGPVVTRFATNDFFGLPKLLDRQAYHTMAAVGASAETWNMGEMDARRGFRQSYFDRDFPAAERLNGWISDQAFFAQMAQRFASQSPPFMAFLMSSSSHFPYQLPVKVQTLNVGHLQSTLLGRYLQGVHYFDGVLGAFVENLKASGVLDQSVLALYGDHHGYLDDPKAVAELIGAPPDDVLATWRTRKRVPFLVRLPHGEAAGPRTVTGGHVDIAPTLLALLGIDVSRTAMLGRDLTMGTDQLAVFRDGSFADGRAYFLNDAGPSPLCYDTAGRRVECATLDAEHRAALERLRVSDAIIRGNLVSSIVGGTSQ